MDSAATIASLIKQLQLNDIPEEREAIVADIKAVISKTPNQFYIVSFIGSYGQNEYVPLNNKVIGLLTAVTDGSLDSDNYLYEKVTSDAYDVEVEARTRRPPKEKKQRGGKRATKKTTAGAGRTYGARLVPTQRVSAVMNTLSNL